MKTRISLISILIVMLAACSPGSAITPTSLPTTEPPTALPTLPAPTNTPPVVAPTVTALQPTATLAIAPTTAANTSTPLPLVTGIYNPYAVVLVIPGDVLNIRTGAGVENAIASTLQPTASGVNRTGPVSSAGGDRWMEIQNPSGGNGWVNANFLTEHVTSATFCADSRVNGLLNSLKTALL